MSEKVFLGTLRGDVKLRADGFLPYNDGSTRNRLYLSKHEWDCGWYWGFGYIGNSALHTHFDNTFLVAGCEKKVNKIFVKPRFSQEKWEAICKLFKQARVLRKKADASHNTKTIEDYKKYNSQLEAILDIIWKEVCNA